MSRSELLFDRYEVVRHVAGCETQKALIGGRGRCRFCGETSKAQFRREAHTFPEALGNKWVFSLDECDKCNGLFSVYEGELVNSVAPLLTISGVKGKESKIRKHGRTAGNFTIRRCGNNIKFLVNNHEVQRFIGTDITTGRLRLETPVAALPFHPRLAYKALCKMALAVMPEEELCHYEKVRQWLQERDDNLCFPLLDVGLSLGRIDKALPFVSGVLLRRISSRDIVPYMLFLLSTGPICFQIALMSDHLEDHLPPTSKGAISIRWTVVLVNEADDDAVSIDFGTPFHLNWSSSQPQPQPLRTIVTSCSPRTGDGSTTLRFRE